ncbi:glycosyltransferase family 4 protein [Roseobacter sp. OBYS 0001]|uniref:glycosyltransferase family 4 protein n=1 Tax=Roseobacter sp. OBYS 0001 TaxID=882651 RepID=UPI001BBF097F|nr:glycosyltransferase family 4 protein [Roseobacter sp. OBYS 0001]GIT89246.1 colanic acid biosynthesis glycosyltransferase WcaL [Roseobacter sp. OBYS 0001]
MIDHQMTGPVAYVTGEYPKVSHTFIQREIMALRHLGLSVETCTVRRAPAETVVGKAQKAEEANTFGILEAAKSPITLIHAHAAIIRQSPRRWGAAIGLAWRTRPAGLRSGLWQLFYFLEAAVLARHLKMKSVRHIHNHFANSSCSVTMLASCMSGIPFSFTMHGPAIFYEPMHWRIDEKMARAQFVSCISHFCRAQGMMFADQAHWSKLKIVHCGIDPKKYGQAPRSAFAKRVIFVGRLDAVKGVPLLLDAAAALRARHPDARITIVGDGPHREQLEAQVARLGLGEMVKFLGYRSQDAVADLLAEADMLVLPSFAEGVPVVLMEAMAARLPVIASQVAGVGELVEDGVSGHVIPAGDTQTLIARMDRLLSHPEVCAQMGKAGRAKVEADFDINKEATWLKTLLTSDDPTPQPLRPAVSTDGPDVPPRLGSCR